MPRAVPQPTYDEIKKAIAVGWWAHGEGMSMQDNPYPAQDPRRKYYANGWQAAKEESENVE